MYYPTALISLIPLLQKRVMHRKNNFSALRKSVCNSVIALGMTVLDWHPIKVVTCLHMF